MPRIKLNRPPADPVKAIMLERKNAMSMTNEELAAKVGLSRNTMQKHFREVHTDDWPFGQVKRICRVLGIPIQELRDATKY